MIKMIHDEGGKVFLDLKYHDIPNTVAKACEAAAKLGVYLVDIHTSGGSEMMLRAAEAVQSFGKKRPQLIGVTVLTSDENKKSVKNEVLKRTQLALESGLDGIVCSPWETAFLRSKIKKILLL
ncbi:MAG: orotidine 5'-phosphate decarboxylase [Deltaproteobacteria bacterium]|nr:MAG: orotidine 5'-phosphate decarboxylase [Deltaproteobacteria bacterium]